MTARNLNLLLDPSAQPANGFQYGNVLQWYGGALEVDFTGVFGGASVDVYASTKLPLDGHFYLNDDGVTKQVADTDWVKLTAASLTVAGRFSLANLNPCLLVVGIASSGGTTRIKGLMNSAT